MENRLRNVSFIFFLFAGCVLFFIGCKKQVQQSITLEHKDSGQFFLPNQKIGKCYITIKASEKEKSEKLADDVLSESLVGLAALAVNENRSETMYWMKVDNNTYNRLESELPLRKVGEMTSWEILQSAEARKIVKGYILYDLKNQESLNVATVAAHVYEGVLIEKAQKHDIEQLGYKQLYDASSKTIEDSWHEFKTKCNNNALVLMPTLTSNHKSTAIALRLMIINLNKIQNHPEMGQNAELFKNILAWLQPLSPVLGWEGNVGEDVFVNPVTQYGHVMFASDWMYNTPLLMADYKNRQKGFMNSLDPRKINYGDAEHYTTFYMSDGDNIQWMLGGFDTSTYYNNQYASETKMSFGYALAGLSQIAPEQNTYLIGKKAPDVTLMECFGGGYFYIDTFAKYRNREKTLSLLAQKVGIIMNQYGCNVLTMIGYDVNSNDSKQGYQTFIENNDNLIGIIVIQYSPYAGGKGNIMWFKNKNGIHIPVITARYALWNHEGNNIDTQGSPAYIADCYNKFVEQETNPTFSCISVHAWSKFNGINDDNVTGELHNGAVSGVEPAYWCQKRLSKKIKVVNAEELIWQLRMHVYPDETKSILEKYN